MNRDSVALWLQKYIQAWRTYDPQAISDLFTEDATYVITPGTAGKGTEAIVANWLKSPDAPTVGAPSTSRTR